MKSSAADSRIKQRLAEVDWQRIEESLWCDGHAVTPRLLSDAECADIVNYYDDDSRFRSRVVMARFGFGKGEYKYFKAPLPVLIGELREQFYPRIAPIANRWAEAIGGDTFPEKYSD